MKNTDLSLVDGHSQRNKQVCGRSLRRKGDICSLLMKWLKTRRDLSGQNGGTINPTDCVERVLSKCHKRNRFGVKKHQRMAPLPKIPTKKEAWPPTWHRHWKTSCGRWEKELSCRSRWRSTKRIKRSAHMMNFLIKRKSRGSNICKKIDTFTRAIHNLGNEKYFAPCEVSSESQCSSCSQCWTDGNVCGFCGTCVIPTEKTRMPTKKNCHCTDVVHNNFQNFSKKPQKSWQLGGGKRRVDIRNVSKNEKQRFEEDNCELVSQRTGTYVTNDQKGRSLACSENTEELSTGSWTAN